MEAPQVSMEESAAISLGRAARRQLEPIPAAAPFLDGWPPLVASRPTAARSLPVCQWLSGLATFAAPPTQDLASCVVTGGPTLEWRQTYSADDFGSTFLERYGWTELIGLRGPMASERIACGFLLLGPRIDYPAHSHEAEELYIPLAGAALWQRGELGFELQHPGATILHRAWEPHAMRTRDEPMLALYVWKGGDLAAKSRILGPAL